MLTMIMICHFLHRVVSFPSGNQVALPDRVGGMIYLPWEYRRLGPGLENKGNLRMKEGSVAKSAFQPSIYRHLFDLVRAKIHSLHVPNWETEDARFESSPAGVQLLKVCGVHHS